MHNKILKKFLKTLKWIGITLLSLFLITFVIILTSRQYQASKLKITTENGIQESEYIQIGGTKQYILTRGEDTNNPIILFLHGGPGAQMSSYSYYWQTELEEKYTIVQWDQRGCGRTYFKNINLQNQSQPSIDAMLSDLDELVDYLCEKYKKDKVIIMGHSWGTLLGSLYIQQSPQKVAAYIGVGQVINTIEGEKLAAEKAVELAGNYADQTTELDINETYNDFFANVNADTDENVDMKMYVKLKSIEAKYLPCGENMSFFSEFWMGLSSPYMNSNSLKWYLLPMTDFDTFAETNISLYNWFFQNGGVSLYDYEMTYSVPTYYISGDCDWTTPYPLVIDYYEAINSPRKDMMIIHNAGHNSFNDKPDEFNKAVLQFLSQ